MCSRCRPKISTFLTPHPEAKCPLYKAYYCPVCAKRGHTLSMCERKLSGARPPAPKAEPEPDVLPTLDIKDNDAVIAAYLAARSQPVSKIPAENRETLEEYAAEEGLVLVRHWEARIILPDRAAAATSAAPATIETTATVSSTTTLGELVESLRSRGFELPKKLSVTTASGKPLKSIESLTYKDVIRIIPRI